MRKVRDPSILRIGLFLRDLSHHVKIQICDFIEPTSIPEQYHINAFSFCRLKLSKSWQDIGFCGMSHPRRASNSITNGYYFDRCSRILPYLL